MRSAPSLYDELTRTTAPAITSPRQVVLSVPKAPPRQIRQESRDARYAAVLAYVRDSEGPATISGIASSLKITHVTARKTLVVLRDEGLIRTVGLNSKLRWVAT